VRAEWKPNLAERVVLRGLFLLARMAQGSEARLVATECVRVMGIRGTLRYTATALKVTKLLEGEFGGITAQFLIGLASLFIGCGFCTYGHVMAGAVLWFRERGELHPLDHYVARDLFEMTDAEIREKLERQLRQPEHQRLLLLVLRMHDLYLECAEGTWPEDPYLEACLWMWRWTTECSIVDGITRTPETSTPNHPVGRDRATLERFERARREARSASPA